MPGIARLRRQAIVLAILTAVIGTIEAVAALAIGVASGSPSLTGFGAESALKAAAALVIAWELGGEWTARQERLALRALALGFMGVSAYAATAAGTAVVRGDDADTGGLALAVAVVGTIAFPVLAVCKHRIGRAMGSRTVVSDARKTWLYAALSASVLFGLLLDMAAGWWWADPAAGGVIAAVAAREGVSEWRSARSQGQHTEPRLHKPGAKV